MPCNTDSSGACQCSRPSLFVYISNSPLSKTVSDMSLVPSICDRRFRLSVIIQKPPRIEMFSIVAVYVLVEMYRPLNGDEIEPQLFQENVTSNSPNVRVTDRVLRQEISFIIIILSEPMRYSCGKRECMLVYLPLLPYPVGLSLSSALFL